MWRKRDFHRQRHLYWLLKLYSPITSHGQRARGWHGETERCLPGREYQWLKELACTANLLLMSKARQKARCRQLLGSSRGRLLVIRFMTEWVPGRLCPTYKKPFLKALCLTCMPRLRGERLDEVCGSSSECGTFLMWALCERAYIKVISAWNKHLGGAVDFGRQLSCGVW